MVVGAGGSVWAQRKVRRTVERYLPEQVSRQVGDQARQIGADVRAALVEGRQAMAEREAELRAQLEARGDRARGPRRSASHRSVIDAAAAELPPGRRLPRAGRGQRARQLPRADRQLLRADRQQPDRTPARQLVRETERQAAEPAEREQLEHRQASSHQARRPRR